MKEIENYLINPDAICRIINQSNRNLKKKVTNDQLFEKIFETSESMYEDTVDSIATEYYAIKKMV